MNLDWTASGFHFFLKTCCLVNSLWIPGHTRVIPKVWKLFAWLLITLPCLLLPPLLTKPSLSLLGCVVLVAIFNGVPACRYRQLRSLWYYSVFELTRRLNLSKYMESYAWMSKTFTSGIGSLHLVAWKFRTKKEVGHRQLPTRQSQRLDQIMLEDWWITLDDFCILISKVSWSTIQRQPVGPCYEYL